MTTKSQIIIGGLGSNILVGTPRADKLVGGSGSDTVRGNGGNDTLKGGSGNDVLYGGDGHDVLSGGAGHDYLDGGSENDSLDGGSGNDTLIGGTGSDTLLGGSGNDYLDGGAGSNLLEGGSGDDTLIFTKQVHSGKSESIKGDSGTDTLVLNFRSSEYLTSSAEIQAYLSLLKSGEGREQNDRIFEFKTLGLKVASIEKLVVTILNDDPLAVADLAIQTEDESLISGSVLLNDTDLDAGQVLEVTNIGTQVGTRVRHQILFSPVFDPSPLTKSST